MKTVTVVVTAQLAGMRIDVAFVTANVDLSRRKIREIIDAGGAYVNNKRVRIASRKVSVGDKLRLEYSLQTLNKIKHQSFVFSDDEILYDEHGVIAVNKPPGLPSQSTLDQSVLHVIPCLNAYYEQKNEKPPKLILVHRLDKETSGVLVLAKNEKMNLELSDQFRSRTMEKTYYAICSGIPKKKNFTVECFLSPIHKKLGIVSKVRSGGKPSKTDFEVLASNPKYNISLIVCRPHTGRSHQIRVHLDLEGHPIIGDKRYGNINYDRLPKDLTALVSEYHFLHAKTLAFVLGGVDQKVEISAPLPKNFAEFAQKSGLLTN